MLLRMSTWEKIRAQFSQAEKDELNAAITGEVICPRGLIIDEDKLTIALNEKLGAAKANCP